MKLAAALTDEDLAHARAVGVGREQLALRLGRTQPFGAPSDSLHGNCYGALAECAVARWLGLPWNDELLEDLTVKPPDVGSRIEVRWTPQPRGHLIAHHTDRDDWIMVLVCGVLPDIEAAGWTTGAAAKQPCYAGHPKARSPEDYWVPRNDLLMPDLLASMRL